METQPHIAETQVSEPYPPGTVKPVAVLLPRKRQGPLFLVAGGLGVSCLICAVAAELCGVPHGLLWGGCAGFLFPLILVVALDTHRRLRREYRAVEAMKSGRPLAELLQPGSLLHELAVEYGGFEDLLADGGVSGEAVCIATVRESPVDHAQPLLVPFEPVPLDESDAAFLQLAATDATSREGAQIPHLGELELPETGRRLRRAWRLAGTGALAICVYAIMETLATGFSWTSFAGFGCMLIILLGAGRFVSPMTGAWYIFPGGVIDVNRRHVFRRQGGLLIWYPKDQKLCLTDAKHRKAFSRKVTRAEGLLALRAWLSPMPAPSDEMIEAFLAGRQ